MGPIAISKFTFENANSLIPEQLFGLDLTICRDFVSILHMGESSKLPKS